MKRIFLFVLIPFICCCVSCSQQMKITLPFSAAEVEEVEVYQFSVPAQAEQKRVTAGEDIQDIVALLTPWPFRKIWWSRLPEELRPAFDSGCAAVRTMKLYMFPMG